MSSQLRILLLAFGLLLTSSLAWGHGAESAAYRVHTVYKGQRLGSISKRYNVSIAALCNANGIDRRHVIKPGLRLLIPSRQDKDGSAARKLRESGKWSGGQPAKTERDGKRLRKLGKLGKPKTHRVYKGQRLGSIAKRYNVTVEALCHANGIRRKGHIRPKQKLYIPPRGDKDGSYTRQWRLDDLAGVEVGRRGVRGPWSKYAKLPKKRGYVELIGHGQKWKGYVIGQGNKILGGARRAISRVLTAPKNRQTVNPRLIRLMAKVSDTFGGRPLRIISGYRTTSFVKNSKHKTGRAVDFRIPGVPNEVLRDYLRTFDKVGVGYYPNSTFVHFDVRGRSAYWIDYAGPGQAPILRRPGKRQASK